MTIEKIALTPEIEAELIELSALWEQEDICFGYRKNSRDDIKDEEIFLAKDGEKISGYLFCHKYTQEKKSATVPEASPCLEIEELFIRPEYRSQGIGKALYNAAIAHFESEIDFVTLGTATKNYRAILHFYIEELGMTFWSARLFQKIR